MSNDFLTEGLHCFLPVSPLGAFPHFLSPWFSFLGEKRLQREKSEQALDDLEDLRGPIHLPVLKQGKSSYKRGFDEGDVHPQSKKKKIDLIFKDVLEASLETAKVEARQLALSTSLVIRKVPKYQGDAYSQCAMTMSRGMQNVSRTQGEGDWKTPQGASTEPGPLDDEEEEPSSFKADSPAEASLASDPHELPTTSFCPNCIRLKKKVRELQAELDMLKSGKLPEPPVLPAQVLELPEFSDPAGKSVWVRWCRREERTVGSMRVAGALREPPSGKPEACDSDVSSGYSPRPQVPPSDRSLCSSCGCSVSCPVFSSIKDIPLQKGCVLCS